MQPLSPTSRCGRGGGSELLVFFFSFFFGTPWEITLRLREKKTVSIHPVVLLGAEDPPATLPDPVGRSIDPSLSRLNVTRFVQQPLTAIPLVSEPFQAGARSGVAEENPSKRPGRSGPEGNESNTLILNYFDRRCGSFRRIHLAFLRSQSADNRTRR